MGSCLKTKFRIKNCIRAHKNIKVTKMICMEVGEYAFRPIIKER